jgi:branched-chain amino acid transport system permease protein
LLTVLICAGYGCVINRGIWQPMRSRGTVLIQMFIITIGLSLLLRHLVLLWFGSRTRPYREYSFQSAIQIGPISVTPRDLFIIVASMVVLVAVGLMLAKTSIGKAMRAVADNRDLAESSGIDVSRVVMVVWMFSGALAALGGIFFGLTEILAWDMGFQLLLLMFAAVILGGLGTAYGAMVGGLLIGLVAKLSTLWFSSELEEAWALLVLIIVLLIRPQGILGRSERVG